jgi:hypothetical protein
MTAQATGPKGAKSEFVFGDSEGSGPNKLLGLLPVETFLVQYTDGESRPCARLVFKVPGAEEVHILRDKIQGSSLVTMANKWFRDAFNNKLKERKGEGDAGVEAL